MALHLESFVKRLAAERVLRRERKTTKQGGFSVRKEKKNRREKTHETDG